MSAAVQKFVMGANRAPMNQRSALGSTSLASKWASSMREGVTGGRSYATVDEDVTMHQVQASANQDESSTTPGGVRRRTNMSRADLIKKACAAHGFEDTNTVGDVETARVVRASNAYGSQLQTKSIGAPAATSLRADPGQIVTTSPSNIGDAFKVFFGESLFPYKSDYDVADQDTWTLPQAFQGRPLPRISETIEQLVFLEGNWYQQSVAPIELTTGLGVQWSRWEFNPHLADVVPELGVNRLVNSRRIENSARFVRRGIGFMLEHGFMLTPEGVTHYLMNINQLVQAAVETNKFDLIHTLLTSHDQNKNWLVSNGLFAGKRVEDVYKRGELFYWDIIKKQKNGLELLDTRISEDMNRWRGEADTWIIHPDIADFLTQRPSEKTDYFIAGAAGPQTLRDGPDAFTSFRGNLVFKTRAYHVDEDDPVDIMRFPSQIGEHHWMSDRYPDCLQDIDYQSCFRDVQVYDEDKDKFATVTLMDALKHSNRFDAESGEVLTFQDRGFLNKYAKSELANDVLHHTLANGKIATVTYFANVKAHHLSAKSRLALGETVKQRLRGIRGADKAEQLLASVRTAIAQMEAYEWNADTKAYLDAIGGALGGAVASSRADRSGNLPLFDLNEYEVSASTGSNTLPADAAGDPQGGLLPPGFQSWEGIKEIVEKWRQIKANDSKAASFFRNVSDALLNDLEEFADFYEQVLRKIKTIFGDSELLNTRNASSWWQRASAGTVLFNNVVHKYRVPLWFQGGAGAGQDSANPANAADALGPAAISGLQAYVQPILASAQRVLQNATNGGPPNTQRIINNYLQPGGAQLPAADANGNYADGTQLGVLALTRSNAQQFIPAVWNVLFLSTIVANLANAADQQVLDAKLAKIETDIVGAFYANDDAVTKQLQNAGAAFEALKKLSKTKKSRREGDPNLAPFFAVEYDVLQENSVEIHQRLANIVASQQQTNDLLNSTGAAVRTTLLAAPKLLAGIAEELRDNGAGQLTWLPSNPVIPDLVITVDDLLDQAEKSGRDSSERAAAFIDYEMLSTMGSLSVAELQQMSGNVEFVQIANSLDHLNQMFPGQMQQALPDDGTSPLQGHRAAAAHIGASMQHDAVEFIGDDSATVGDLARGRTALGDTSDVAGGLSPSRRALAQGLSHFTAARKALLTDSARRNFALLADSEADSWAYVFASVFNYSPVNLKQLRSIVTNNVLFPFNFILSRPHARYECDYMIKLKRGSDTVSTYQRRGRFEVGDDVNVGAHVGHYRYYSKVVVKQPKNVAIARCVYVADYHGGMGSHFINREDYKPAEGEYGAGSLFALLVGYEENEDTAPNVINVSGTINDMRDLYDLNGEEQLHYSSAAYYNSYWGWVAGSSSLEVDRSRVQYVNQAANVNFNTLKGTTKLRDFQSKQFKMLDSGVGHWGDEATYNGVAKARIGQATYRPANTVGVSFV